VLLACSVTIFSIAAIGEGGASADHLDCGEEVAGDEEFLPEL
jgi:hypothetical protein